MKYFGSYEAVTPGELIADEGRGGDGTYTEGNKIFSKYLGTVGYNGDVATVSPIRSIYIPQEGDEVIGKITEVSNKYWVVDIGVPYYTRLDARDLNMRVNPGELDSVIERDDLIYARIFRVSPGRMADLSMRGSRYSKLPTRTISSVEPVKLPRLIGKEGATINAIKTTTKCNILIGQNGIVWIDGDEKNRVAALSVIKLIDESYYDPNLKEKVDKLLDYVRTKI